MLEYNATFEVQIAEWTPAGLVTKIEVKIFRPQSFKLWFIEGFLLRFLGLRIGVAFN